MLVYQHPARAALLPNSGVPEIQFNCLTVFCFIHQMHWDGHPSDRPAAGHLQVLTRSQLDLRRTVQKLLLHAVVVLLPTVVRKRRDIIKNESVVLVVELRRRIRRPRAPSGAIAVDELAKRGVGDALLLRACTTASHQSPDYCR